MYLCNEFISGRNIYSMALLTSVGGTNNYYWHLHYVCVESLCVVVANCEALG